MTKEELELELSNCKQYSGQLEKINESRNEQIYELSRKLESEVNDIKLNHMNEVSELRAIIKKRDDEIQYMNDTYKPCENTKIQMLREKDSEIEKLKNEIKELMDKKERLFDKYRHIESELTEAKQENEKMTTFLEKQKEAYIDFLGDDSDSCCGCCEC